MRTKIFIDFDGTLYNTSKAKGDLFLIFEKAGFSRDEILSAYQAECLDYKFSPPRFMDRLGRIRKYNISLAKARIDNLITSASKYLYEDTIPFLEKLDREKYEVNLITMGNKDFQKLKVESSGITKFFENSYYTDEQKWLYFPKIISGDEKFIFIDDRSDTVYNVGKIFPRAMALTIDRKDEDRDDTARAVHMKTLSIKNFNQASLYL
ncbi:MAG: HAD family hydrolase [Patescibacteria group bacterium]